MTLIIGAQSELFTIEFAFKIDFWHTKYFRIKLLKMTPNSSATFYNLKRMSIFQEIRVPQKDFWELEMGPKTP